jgi:hypothetical protein
MLGDVMPVMRVMRVMRLAVPRMVLVPGLRKGRARHQQAHARRQSQYQIEFLHNPVAAPVDNGASIAHRYPGRCCKRATKVCGCRERPPRRLDLAGTMCAESVSIAGSHVSHL